MKINSIVEKVSKPVRSYPYIGEDRRDGILVLFIREGDGIALSRNEKSLFDVGCKVWVNEWHFGVTAKHVTLSNDLLT